MQRFVKLARKQKQASEVDCHHIRHYKLMRSTFIQNERKWTTDEPTQWQERKTNETEACISEHSATRLKYMWCVLLDFFLLIFFAVCHANQIDKNINSEKIMWIHFHSISICMFQLDSWLLDSVSCFTGSVSLLNNDNIFAHSYRKSMCFSPLLKSFGTLSCIFVSVAITSQQTANCLTYFSLSTEFCVTFGHR